MQCTPIPLPMATPSPSLPLPPHHKQINPVELSFHLMGVNITSKIIIVCAGTTRHWHGLALLCSLLSFQCSFSCVHQCANHKQLLSVCECNYGVTCEYKIFEPMPIHKLSLFIFTCSPIGFYATIAFLTSVYAGVLFAYLIVSNKHTS